MIEEVKKYIPETKYSFLIDLNNNINTGDDVSYKLILDNGVFG